MNSEQRIQKLRKELNQHNINYYVHDNPTISDAEYDRLIKELEFLTDLSFKRFSISLFIFEL